MKPHRGLCEAKLTRMVLGLPLVWSRGVHIVRAIRHDDRQVSHAQYARLQQSDYSCQLHQFLTKGRNVTLGGTCKEIVLYPLPLLEKIHRTHYTSINAGP
jgi:hypothetical protein